MSVPGPAGRPGPRHAAAAIRVNSPLSLLAAVPVTLGFRPAAPSIAVLAAVPSRPGGLVALRYDLPGDLGTAGYVALNLGEQGASAVYAVGYGPDSAVTPAADALRAELADAGIAVREFLRAETGRYFSYVCADHGCCPPEGTRYELEDHPVTRQYGHLILPSRLALAETIAPLPDPQASAMREAARSARDRAALLTVGAAQGVNPKRAVAEAGLDAVDEAVRMVRSGGRLGSHEDAAWLLLTLNELPVRDYAWAYMDPAHCGDHVRLWTELTALAQGRDAAAPAALLAFTAWQSGDGALASIAVERALGADPQYRMATMLGDCLDAMIPPSMARSMAMLPSTPAGIAAHYGYTRPGTPNTPAVKPGALRPQQPRAPGSSRPRRRQDSPPSHPTR